MVGETDSPVVVLLGNREEFGIVFSLWDISYVFASQRTSIEVYGRHNQIIIIISTYLFNHKNNKMGAETYKIPGPNNSLYEGQCNKEGKYHGKGRLKYEDGSIFEGQFDSGVPVDGKFQYKNKDVYEGTLKNSKPEGNGKWTDAKGVFEGNFKDGNFINGTINYRDGSKYKGYMERGFKHGPAAEYTFPDGDRFMGTFECDKFTSGVYENANGERYEGSFDNGQMDG